MSIREMIFSIDPTTLRLVTDKWSDAVVVWVGYTGHGYGSGLVADGAYRLSTGSGNSYDCRMTPFLSLSHNECHFYVSNEVLQNHLERQHDDALLGTTFGQLLSFVGYHNPTMLLSLMEAMSEIQKKQAYMNGKEDLQQNLRGLLGI